MSELAYEIREKTRLLRLATDRVVKRKLSLELGELQHRLTLFLLQLPKETTPSPPSREPRLGDRVEVLGK
jgi:hypothetical protein